MKVLSVLEPIWEDVSAWLDGDQVELPTSLRALPPELRHEVELRLIRARSELRGERVASAPPAGETP